MKMSMHQLTCLSAQSRRVRRVAGHIPNERFTEQHLNGHWSCGAQCNVIAKQKYLHIEHVSFPIDTQA